MLGIQCALPTFWLQSWVNRPLSAKEAQQLQSIGALGGHLAAALPLLAHELEDSALQLSVLHPDQASVFSSGPRNSDAITRYIQETADCAGGWPASFRLLLTPGEEQRLMGTRRAARGIPAWRRRGHCALVEVPECPVVSSAVEGHEAALAALVGTPPSRSSELSELPAYPLASKLNDPAALLLEKEMHEELKASCDAHHSLNSATEVASRTRECITELEVSGWAEVAASVKSQSCAAVQPFNGQSKMKTALIHTLLLLSQGKVTSQRTEVQDYLLQHISNVPADVGCHGAAFRLRRISGSAPAVAPLDLLYLTLRPEVLGELNPFLTEASHARLLHGVGVWLQLCVLEDRLGRVSAFAGAGKAFLPALVQVRVARSSCAG